MSIAKAYGGLGYGLGYGISLALIGLAKRVEGR
jgi:hypothetical protein